MRRQKAGSMRWRARQAVASKGRARRLGIGEITTHCAPFSQNPSTRLRSSRSQPNRPRRNQPNGDGTRAPAGGQSEYAVQFLRQMDVRRYQWWQHRVPKGARSRRATSRPRRGVRPESSNTCRRDSGGYAARKRRLGHLKTSLQGCAPSQSTPMIQVNAGLEKLGKLCGARQLLGRCQVAATIALRLFRQVGGETADEVDRVCC